MHVINNLNDRQKEIGILCLLLLIYGTWAIFSSPAFLGYGYDREVYYYMGMLIANGGIPHIDAFESKPPLIYIINYLGFIITPNSMWGVFLLLNSLGFTSSVIVYRIAKQVNSNTLLSFVITVIYIATINYTKWLEGGNLTRQLCAYLVVFFIYFYLNREKNRLRLFASGMILSLIFFTQQNEILVPFLILFSGLFMDYRKVSFKKALIHVLFISTGFLMPLLLIALLVYAWGNFDEFIYQVYMFNFIQMKNVSVSTRFIDAISIFINKLELKQLLYFLPILLTIYNLIRYRSINIKTALIISAFIVQLYSISISGKNWNHYYLLLIPYMTFMLIFSFERVSINKVYLRVISITVILLLFIELINYIRIDYSNIDYQKKEVALINAEVSKKSNQKGQFYSFDFKYLKVNNDLNIIAPTKWIYHFAYSVSDPFIPQIIDEIIYGLDKYKTTYILISKERKQEKINSFLVANYRPKLELDKLILYIRN